MTARIRVNPELLTWARERTRLGTLALTGRLGAGATTSMEGTHG